MGPVIGLAVGVVYYLGRFSERQEKPRTGSRSKTTLSENLADKARKVQKQVVEAAEQERRDKIRNRKKTPAAKPASDSPPKKSAAPKS